MSHDQPTQVIQHVDPHGQQPEEQPKRAGCGCLGPLILLFALLIGVIATALLVTPPRETVMLLGSDARPDEIRRGDVGRTDTLLLLVADRGTPRVGLISVPRDLWVPIPGYGEERINAAYALGGAQSAKTAMTNTVGVQIDRYLVIGLQSVRDVVNALGGIDVTVDEAIYDPAYPTDDYGIVEVRIPAGRQRMDGETALRYARTRHQDSDFGRIARQQKVFNALRNEMLKPQNWPRVPAALAAFIGGSKTDLQPFDYIAISAAFLRDFGEPQRLVLDANYVEPFTGAGGAALLAPRPNLRAGVARFLGNSTPRVEVLNGSSVPGAARNAADRLSRGGYEIVTIGDADAATSDTTIVLRAESRRLADGVINTLGASTQRTVIVESNNLPSGVDLRVIVGRDMTV